MKNQSKLLFSSTFILAAILFVSSFTFVIEQFCSGRINNASTTTIEMSITNGDIPAVGLSAKVAMEVEIELNGQKSKTWVDVAKITVIQSTSTSVRCKIDELLKNNLGQSPEQYLQSTTNPTRIQWRLAQ